MTSSAMTAMSVALVVMVLTILLGFVHGMRRTVTSAAEQGNWILLARDAKDETGYINHENIQILRTMPQIATDAAGNPLMSLEAPVPFDPSPDAPRASTAYVRAVRPVAYEVHRGIRIVEGRRPERGKNEWLVGQRLAARHPFFRPGATFRWLRNDWHVVGIFSDNGSGRESEAWADFDDIITTFHLPPGTMGANSIHVILKPGYEEPFAEALHADSRLRVDLMSERDFYSQAAGFSDQIRRLGLVVAAILAIGAVFGAMNTMYSAVARRKREVGTLRVLGFGRGSVLTAFILESATLAVIGGVIGEILAVVVAQATGLDSRLMNVGTVLFSFRLPGSAFPAGIIAAIIIGVVGGLLPAWQAAQLNVVDSLRD
ncbi:MAG TPA: FtsX-like permease family protein [Candidatus Binataceae bacterium]|nr:FtsX-like permease family protein [Candidatus Binataceae bacterium]